MQQTMQARCSSATSCSYTLTTPRAARLQQSRSILQAFGLPEQLRCLSRRFRVDRKAKQALQVCNSAQEVIGVLIFSALPFTAVQTLADSDFGKNLRKNLEEKKPKLEREARDRSKQQTEARRKSMWYGAERPKYLGPIPADYPDHLRGDAPGDYAFDILNLGATQDSFDRYYELELQHARWAMLSAFGILVPEVLQYTGVSNFSESRWQYVGYAKLQGEDLNYFGISGLRIAGNQGVAIIAVCQVLLMFGPEFARSKGPAALEPLGIYLPGDKNYPGGVFDPLGIANNAEAFEDLRVKEIKNGRLAMIAWLGFAAQAFVTGKGPVENLLDVLPSL